MNAELLTVLAQFGPAGLIGLLWITERKAAAVRERKLAEAHRALAERDHLIDAVLKVVKDNTKAIVCLEQTQRQLIDMAGGLARQVARRTARNDEPSG